MRLCILISSIFAETNRLAYSILYHSNSPKRGLDRILSTLHTAPEMLHERTGRDISLSFIKEGGILGMRFVYRVSPICLSVFRTDVTCWEDYTRYVCFELKCRLRVRYFMRKRDVISTGVYAAIIIILRGEIILRV